MAQVKVKSAIEKSLEAAVFGQDNPFDLYDNDSDGSDLEAEAADKSLQNQGAIEHDGGLEDEQLFMIDDGNDQEMKDVQTEEETETKIAPSEQIDSRASAWQDSDDEKLSISLASAPRLRKLRHTEEEDVVSGIEYARRLRAQFERVYAVPDWALPSQASRKRRRRGSQESQSGSDSDISPDTNLIASAADPLKALFKTSESYVRKNKTLVRTPGQLPIKRLRDANHQAPAHSAIQAMAYHPTFPLLMTGGYDRTLRIYHIDGKLNTPASSLYLKNVPVETAAFHPDGRRVFIGGKRKYFHIWDLETGKVEKISRVYGHEGMQNNMEKFVLSTSGDHIAVVASGGWVNILAASTGQWIDAFKVTRGVSDLVWHKSGHLTVANRGAELWEYSLESRKVVRRWSDDGGMDTTRIAVGGQDDRWLAVGSKSGIVNVYDRLDKSNSGPSPKPQRTLQQITTAIHELQISPDGQILAMSSRAKKDVLKLVHLPSCTVFQNWPTQNTPLGKIGAIAFSPGSEMFSVGNEAGRVTLWSI